MINYYDSLINSNLDNYSRDRLKEHLRFIKKEQKNRFRVAEVSRRYPLELREYRNIDTSDQLFMTQEDANMFPRYILAN